MGTYLSAQEVRQAIASYGPVLKFHPDERFHACSVEAFLAHAKLHDKATGQEINHPAIGQLPTGSDNDGRYWFILEDAFKSGDLATAKAYVRAVSVGDGNCTDLQFWILYAYNGPGTACIEIPGVKTTNVNMAPLGEHYGDWECCVIRIDNQSKQMIGCTLSQHGTDVVFTAGDLSQFQRANGQQIVIYASLNGHALYAHSATNASEDHDYKVLRGYLRNDTADGGQQLNCAANYQIISTNWLGDEYPEPQWVNYPYRWGPEGTSTNIVDAVGKSVPPGSGSGRPSTKNIFDDIDRGFHQAWNAASAVITNPPSMSELLNMLGDAAYHDDLNGPRAPKMQPTWSAGVRINDEQSSWAWCNKCGGMHFPYAAHPSVCPAGGRHVQDGSGNYALVYGSRARWDSQPGWRWCQKCAGLHFPDGPSVCQAGGRHSTASSYQYFMCYGDAPSSIGTDGRLGNNQRLESPNKHYVLVMQGDGNLVLYAGSQGAIWSSNTSANPTGNLVLVNQADGNLVVYNDHNGAVVWATGGGGKPKGDTTLVLQDDGNLVKYGANGAAIWASNTSRADLHGQGNWRWCNKCGIMHFGDGPSVCPTGGAHSNTGSGNYAMTYK